VVFGTNFVVEDDNTEDGTAHGSTEDVVCDDSTAVWFFPFMRLMSDNKSGRP
jgi:hypothetical protein